MSKTDNDATKYYWCVNCGWHGEYKTPRYRGIVCEKCNYDAISKLDEKEWKQEAKNKPWILEGKSYEEYHRGKK